MKVVNNKLAGILIQKMVIDANYVADPGNGYLTRAELLDCLEENPRLLEPFLVYAAYNGDFFDKEELSEDIARFVRDLRELNPDGANYMHANFRKTLENYKFYIGSIIPKFFGP